MKKKKCEKNTDFTEKETSQGESETHTTEEGSMCQGSRKRESRYFPPIG